VNSRDWLSFYLQPNKAWWQTFVGAARASITMSRCKAAGGRRPKNGQPSGAISACGTGLVVALGASGDRESTD